MRKGLLILFFILSLVSVSRSYPLIQLTGDSGSFQFYQLDHGIGADNFSIKLQDKIWKIEGNIALNVGNLPSQIYTELGFDQKNLEFKAFQQELWVRELPHKLAMVKKGEKLTLELHSGTSSVRKNFEIPGLFSVVDPFAPELLYFSLALLDNSKDWQKITAIIPSEQREIDGIAISQGKHAAKIGDEYFDAERIFFSFDDLGVTVWIHDNLIIKVEVPATGFRAERRSYNGPKAKSIPSDKTRTGIVENEVEFASADGTKIAGTLVLPANRTDKLPAVLFLADYGRIDRDGNVEGSSLKTGFWDLLDQIALAGFAVLRVDHRGVGKSEGQFITETFSERLVDARKALEFLARQPKVNPKKLIVIGHGEGANLALRLASEPNVSCVVALAPSAISLDELALLQAKDRAVKLGYAESEADRVSPIPDLIKMARENPNKWETFAGRPVFLELYRDWGRVKPLDDLRRIKSPVLICQATRDIQIFRSNAALLEKPCSENKLCEFQWYTGLDHFFVSSQGTLGEYANPDRELDKKLASDVIGWLKSKAQVK